MDNEKPTKPALKILSLEDSQRDFELIEALLTDSGYQPRMDRVDTGPAFVTALQGQAYDIILADFNMPEYDAFSALAETLTHCPEVPFLVVSGAIGEETAIELIKQGAVDYVLKDRPKRLVSAVERALAEAQQRKARQQAEQALEQSNRLFRIAGECARFGGWRVDLKTDTCEWSAIVAEIHERPHDFSPSIDEGLALYAPEWRDKITRAFNDCAQEGIPYDEEMEIITQTGRRVWVRTIGEPVRNEAGEIIEVQGALLDISERKAAEQNLADSEAELRALFANMTDVVIVKDHSGKVLKVAPTKATAMILPPEEMVGKTVDEYLPEEVADFNKQVIKEVLATGETFKGEYPLTLEGEERWFETHASPLTEDSILWVARDITERVQAEQVRERSNRLFRIAGESARFGGWRVDLATNTCEWSDIVAEIHEMPHGYAPPVEEGINFYAPEWHDKITQAFTDCAQKGIPYDEEMEIITQTGRRVWVRTIGEPVRNEAGEIIEVQGALQDISERKVAEQKLAASEAELRALFANMTDVVVVMDDQGKHLSFAPTQSTLLYRPIDEMLGKTVHELLPKNQADYIVAIIKKVLSTGKVIKGEYDLIIDDKQVWLSSSASPLSDNKILWVAHDITERVQAEQALRESEAYIKAVMDNLPIGVAVNTVDPTVKFSYINDNFLKIYRTTREALSGEDTFWEAVYHDPAIRKEIRERVLADCASGDPERMYWEDIPITRPGEATTYITAKNTPVPHKDLMISTVYDTTERVKAEQELRESETRFKELVANLPGAVYLCHNDARYTMTYLTQSIEELTGYPPEEFLSDRISLVDLFHPEDVGAVRAAVDEAVSARIPFRLTYRLHHKEKGYRWMEEYGTGIFEGETLRFLEGFIVDVTEKREIEDALAESERIFQVALMNSPVTVFQQDRELRYTWVYNPIMGYDPEDEIGKTDLERFGSEDGAILTEIKQRVIDSGVGERHILKSTGEKLPLYTDLTVEPLFDAEGVVQGITCSSVDITDFKLAEEAEQQRLAELEALSAITEILRPARTLDEALPILLSETLKALSLPAGCINLFEPESGNLEMVVAAGWFEAIQSIPVKPGVGISGFVFESGQPYMTEDFSKDPQLNPPAVEHVPPGWNGAAIPIMALDETIGVFFVSCQAPQKIEGSQMRLLEALSRIAGITLHRMRLLEDAQKRVSQLQAQRAIDQVLIGTTDLSIALNTICTHALDRLPASAVGVLLFSPHDQSLSYGGGAGFNTSHYQRFRGKIGKGYVGRAALEQQVAKLDDLTVPNPPFLRTELVKAEAFSCYTGLPLVSKGQVKGVLEVFHRNHFDHTEEFYENAQSLAAHLAIAVDSLQMFNNLQRSNLELSRAYDDTIEGWSLALDLRDSATEGHSLRVTDITLALAREMGIDDEELVHVRRGALLHDMGKLGVPDSILHKPGALTDEEWVTDFGQRKGQVLQPGRDIDTSGQGFGEPGDIEGHPDGLGQEQGNADGGADLDAQGTRNDVVRSAAAHPHVGGRGRERQSRQKRDGRGHGDDQQGLAQAHLPQHPAEAQVHDHAQNRQDARGEHPLEGPE